MTHEEAFADLVDLADWSSGFGNCGVWSNRMLASRWSMNQRTVGRFLVQAERLGLIRRTARPTGTQISVLNAQWNFRSGSLPRRPKRRFSQTRQISLTVVATFHNVAESHLEKMLKVSKGRRGRPSRKQADQRMFSMWLYLMNTSGGFTAQQICAETGLHRRAIQHIAASIEDQRDNDPELDAEIIQLEASFRAAEQVLRICG